jgi:hypothetical protein
MGLEARDARLDYEGRAVAGVGGMASVARSHRLLGSPSRSSDSWHGPLSLNR